MPILPTIYSPNCDSRAFMFAACVLSSTIMLITATLDCIKKSPFPKRTGRKKPEALPRRAAALQVTLIHPFAVRFALFPLRQK